jgi:hypothetical protein
MAAEGIMGGVAQEVKRARSGRTNAILDIDDGSVRVMELALAGNRQKGTIERRPSGSRGGRAS